MMIHNPYWEGVKDLLHTPGRTWNEAMGVREAWCRLYSWAIPDPKTLAFVACYLSPRGIEMGAGTGYWSWLLSQHGIDMLAYDHEPPDRVYTNGFHSPYDCDSGTFLNLPTAIYYPMQQREPDALAAFPDRTLFLCWPPPLDDMATECLSCYPGQRFISVGLLDGYHCATEGFLRLLNEEWHQIAHHVPARWESMEDLVVVYERNASTVDKSSRNSR